MSTCPDFPVRWPHTSDFDENSGQTVHQGGDGASGSASRDQNRVRKSWHQWHRQQQQVTATAAINTAETKNTQSTLQTRQLEHTHTPSKIVVSKAPLTHLNTVPNGTPRLLGLRLNSGNILANGADVVAVRALSATRTTDGASFCHSQEAGRTASALNSNRRTHSRLCSRSYVASSSPLSILSRIMVVNASEMYR